MSSETHPPYHSGEITRFLPGKSRAHWRRVFFFGSVLLANSAATAYLGHLFWLDGLHRAHAPMLVLFFVLHGLLLLGAAHAIFGLFAGTKGVRAARITELAKLHAGPLRNRYAVVMPVYEENPARFCARIEAIWRSLQETGYGDAFDVFLLSDTRSAEGWIEEEVAWVNLCRSLGAFGRIFYRRRPTNLNRKAGNIADFVRTTGGSYEAMLVLDADSLMEGRDIVTMAKTMEMHPRLAILQTPPRLVFARSWFARAQQFVMATVGPLFARGLNFWQLSEGSYWGHNALVRLRPFSEYCELPALPGKEPFGGRIFSHDFVEAALLVREGWEVWLAWDITGTYEECPPTLVDHLIRDRRWCQGNLQHVWLLMAKKLRPVVRMHLLGGVLSYLSGPLWFLFLFFGTWLAWDRAHSGLSKIPFTGFVERWTGITPVVQGMLLLAWILLLLFGPRLIAAASVLADGSRAKQFGGRANFCAGIATEVLLSMLLAPVMMVSHTLSVAGIFLGRVVGWNPQSREGEGTRWPDALRFHAPALLLGIVWTAVCWSVGEQFFIWMSPVLVGLLLAVPTSVFTSRPMPEGCALWTTPEISNPTGVLKSVQTAHAFFDSSLDASHESRRGVVAAVIDPYVNAVHLSLLEREPVHSQGASESAELAERCIREGPTALNKTELETLLRDRNTLLSMHRRLWLEHNSEQALCWLHAKQSYRM